MAENNQNKQLSEIPRLEKKKFGERVIDFLFSDRLESIGSYMVNTYIRPGIGNLLYNMGVGALGMLFRRGGAPGSNQMPSDYNYAQGKRDYFAYNTPPNPYYQPQVPMPVPTQYGGGSDTYFISFATENDACIVINDILAEFDKYKRLSVADFYRCARVSPPLGDWSIQGRGWYTIGNPRAIPRTDGRWVIEMPPPIKL